MEFPMRINRYLAHKGHSTRRGADELILKGKVFINGKKAVLGQKIEAKDVVEVRDTSTRAYRYIIYNKARGVITHSPGKGEVDIETKLLKDHGLQGLFPIGRLDKNSEGLMILTDDGRITERLLNPEKEHEREYEVTLDKPITPSLIRKLSGGVLIEGYKTKGAKAEKHESNDKVLRITLTEGKKHQIRRMCAALGYQVQKLKRVRVMNLTLSSIKTGGYRELTGVPKKIFLRDLGI